MAQLMRQCGMFVTAGSYQADVALGLFTHFIREEDSGMSSGRLDDELKRMSAVAAQIGPHALVLVVAVGQVRSGALSVGALIAYLLYVDM